MKNSIPVFLIFLYLLVASCSETYKSERTTLFTSNEMDLIGTRVQIDDSIKTKQVVDEFLFFFSTEEEPYTGTGTFKQDDGVIRNTYYINGHRVGYNWTWADWYDEEKEICTKTGYCIKEELNFVWYKTGQKKYERYRIVNEVENFETVYIRTWYENGKQRFSYDFDSRKTVPREYTIWYESGKKHSEQVGDFQAGLVYYKMWTENRKLIYEKTQEGDFCFDENGDEITQQEFSEIFDDLLNIGRKILNEDFKLR